MTRIKGNATTVFGHEIAVAVPTPQASGGQLRLQALVGALVGLLPVALGLMFYPAMRGFGTSGMNFVLALTVGMLAFLLLDMMGIFTQSKRLRLFKKAPRNRPFGKWIAQLMNCSSPR